jgi:hypothetical protein
VNVIGLENATEVRFIRGSGAESLDRRLLVSECFKERERKALRIKRLVRELRDCFFYFDGIQLFVPSSMSTGAMQPIISDEAIPFHSNICSELARRALIQKRLG